MTDILRKNNASAAAGTPVAWLQLVVFRLGNEEYALPIEQIKEVVLTPTVARIPQTPAYIRGVANVRGNVLAIMDLAQRFGLTDEAHTDLARYTLVMESEQFRVGILVRTVPITLSVPADRVDATPDIVGSGTVGHGLRGIVKHDQRMIFLIDLEHLLKNERVVVEA